MATHGNICTSHTGLPVVIMKPGLTQYLNTQHASTHLVHRVPCKGPKGSVCKSLSACKQAEYDSAQGNRPDERERKACEMMWCKTNDATNMQWAGWGRCSGQLMDMITNKRPFVTHMSCPLEIELHGKKLLFRLRVKTFDLSTMTWNVKTFSKSVLLQSSLTRAQDQSALLPLWG